MRRPPLWTTIAALLFLAANATAQTAANADYAAQVARLDQGLNGFTGTIEPIATPITVAMAPATYDGISTTYEPNLTGTIKVRGAVTRTASEVVHEQSLYDSRVSLTTPVATVRVAANLQGVETKRDVTFPAFGTRTDAQTRQATATFRQMAEGLVADSMRPHVASVGALWQTREEVAKTLTASLPPGVTIASNTVEEKVAGTTLVGDRRAVVVASAGTTMLRIGTDSVVLTLRGYRLIDIASGIEVESLVGSTTNAVVGGKPQPSSTVVTALTRTIRP